MMPARAAEEAAIAAWIVAHGVKRRPQVDPAERAIELWGGSRSGRGEEGGGMRRMVETGLKQKRARGKR